MKNALLLVLAIFISNIAHSQDDMDMLADELLNDQVEYALGTFYTSRIVTGHSVFMMPKRGLDFKVHHRFGEFNSGFNNFYGLDESSSYLGLEYGITDLINIGIGRGTYRDMFNSMLKLSLLRQSTGSKTMPVSVVYMLSAGIQSTIYDDKKRNDDFSARMSYTHQLLIARMFTPALSLQLAPTVVHRNMVPVGDYNNTTYALGVGGRYKLSNTISANAEWFYVLNPDKIGNKTMHDPISIGIDIQIASHVFQIHVTNAQPMIESNFITETKESFFKGNIRPGFNIAQVFTF